MHKELRWGSRSSYIHLLLSIWIRKHAYKDTHLASGAPKEGFYINFLLRVTAASCSNFEAHSHAYQVKMQLLTENTSSAAVSWWNTAVSRIYYSHTSRPRGASARRPNKPTDSVRCWWAWLFLVYTQCVYTYRASFIFPVLACVLNKILHWLNPAINNRLFIC